MWAALQQMLPVLDSYSKFGTQGDDERQTGLPASDSSDANAGSGNRQTAIAIASALGAIIGAALIGGLIGLAFWVRRKRRQDAVRDLSDLGILPHVSAASLPWFLMLHATVCAPGGDACLQAVQMQVFRCTNAHLHGAGCLETYMPKMTNQACHAPAGALELTAAFSQRRATKEACFAPAQSEGAPMLTVAPTSQAGP